MPVWLEQILNPVIMGIFGILGFYLKSLHTKIDNTLTETQIRILIEDKLKPIEAEQENLKLDIERLLDKLDSLCNLLLEGKLLYKDK